MLDRVKKFKSQVLYWAAQQPVFAISLVIIGSILLLPLVSAAALFPFVIILSILDFLQSKGLLTLTYLIFGQGVLLAVIVGILLMITFSAVTGASVLHSKFFQNRVSE